MDLDAVAAELAQNANVDPVLGATNRKAAALVQDIIGGELDFEAIIDYPGEVFMAAVDIASGSSDPQLRAISEQLNPDGFSRLQDGFAALLPTSDPDVGGEFV